MLTIRIASPYRVFRVDLHTAGKLATPIATLSGDTGEGINLDAVNQRINEAIAAIGSTAQSETNVDVLVGQALRMLPSGHLNLAQANSIAAARVCGLALADTESTFGANYSADGVVTRDSWTAVTGTLDLTPGAVYYLSPDAPGKLTAIAPVADGQVVAVVGAALNFKTLAIELQPPILL